MSVQQPSSIPLRFKTTDIPLGAWLYCHNIPLLNIETTGNGLVSLEFDTTPYNTLIKEFEIGQATFLVLAYFNSYQSLLRRIRDYKNSLKFR